MTYVLLFLILLTISPLARGLTAIAAFLGALLFGVSAVILIVYTLIATALGA